MASIMEAFNISMATAGFLSTVFTLVGIIIALPAAMILKKFGPKKAGVAALLFAVVGSTIGYFSDSIGVLIASRVIEGTGIGIIAVLAPALIAMWFPPEKRGLPMGIWGSWMMVSQTVLFFSSSAIVENFSWRGMWLLGLVCCVIAAVLFIIFVESPPTVTSNADVENEKVSIIEGVKSRGSITLALAAMCFTFCTFTFVSWIAQYWGVVTDWSPVEISRWIAILFLVEIVYAWIVGAVLNKVKNRKRFGAIGFIIYGFLGLAAYTITAQPLILVFVFLYPVFDAVVSCTLWTIGPQTATKPIYAGIALGLLNIGLNVGTLLSAPVSGALVENFGWTAAGIAFLVVALVGCVFMFMTKVNSGKDEPEVEVAEAA